LHQFALDDLSLTGEFLFELNPSPMTPNPLLPPQDQIAPSVFIAAEWQPPPETEHQFVLDDLSLTGEDLSVVEPSPREQNDELNPQDHIVPSFFKATL
jgi:hypothetical protein